MQSGIARQLEAFSHRPYLGVGVRADPPRQALLGMDGVWSAEAHTYSHAPGRDCKIYGQLSADRKCNLFHWSLSICIAHFRMILTKELLPYFEVRFPKSQE